MAESNRGVEPLNYTETELEKILGKDWRQTCTSAYRWMLFGRLMDTRFLGLQRQGRVGFYGPATGHEAVNVGCALAIGSGDWVFPGLREQLIALVRGMPLTPYVHHLFGDALDPCMGRQMPCHPTSKGTHYVSMASTVGTQIIQATGCGYAQRYKGNPAITLGFFGDGATSTSDFHAGLNLAAVYGLPVLFVCANNQWAISIPVGKQSAVKVLADKAKAYGIPGVRIDGTDFVKVYSTVKESRDRLLSGKGPELVETLVYRMNPHTSSDDPTRYVPPEWLLEAKAHDPLLRIEGLLERLGMIDEESKENLRQEIETLLKRAISEAEVAPPPSPDTLFKDTLSEAVWPLTEQRDTFDRDQGGHFP